VTRLLIVDDHPVVRRGLRSLLESQAGLEVVGEAGDGGSAPALAAELRADVVVLDLVLGDEDGAEVVRQIRRRAPRAAVVVLTSYHGDELIARSLRAGALSYLLKDSEPDELVKAVRAAARGESVLHPHVAARVLGQLRGERLTDDLTPREMEVLTRIARGQTNREIAAGLYVSDETVKSHVSSVLAKLRLADRTQAAVYALRRGLVPLDE
jgi:NarL family two-component system response regulator LiaR